MNLPDIKNHYNFKFFLISNLKTIRICHLILVTAILVAAIAGFVFSAIWYTALFGKTWAKEMGFDMNQAGARFMVKKPGHAIHQVITFIPCIHP